MNDDNGYRGWDLFAILTIAFLIFAAPITVCLLMPPTSEAATPSRVSRPANEWSAAILPGYACPVPSAAPFRYRPSGCSILGRMDVVTLPRQATEVDVWTLNGKRRLRQAADAYPCKCEQWTFSYGPFYSAGWDVTNRDIYNYGRTVIVYFWEG
jgi:hypothetical protein